MRATLDRNLFFFVANPFLFFEAATRWLVFAMKVDLERPLVFSGPLDSHNVS